MDELSLLPLEVLWPGESVWERVPYRVVEEVFLDGLVVAPEDMLDQHQRLSAGEVLCFGGVMVRTQKVFH